MARKTQRKRQPRGGRKTLRRSGSVKRSRARRKDWTARAEQDWDDLSYDVVERVMPRDERDRRRQIEEAIVAARQPASDGNHDGNDGGGDNRDATGDAPRLIPTDARQALVTEVAGMSARIELDGERHPATVRGLLTEIDTGYINPVAVGDRAIVTEDGAGAWAIQDILPRKTTLTRPDPFLAPRQQVIAANVDQLLIVASWRDPDLWLELIDRYLIAAGLSGDSAYRLHQQGGPDRGFRRIRGGDAPAPRRMATHGRPRGVDLGDRRSGRQRT